MPWPQKQRNINQICGEIPSDNTRTCTCDRIGFMKERRDDNESVTSAQGGGNVAMLVNVGYVEYDGCLELAAQRRK